MLRRHKKLVGAAVFAPYAWFALVILHMVASAIALLSGHDMDGAFAGMALLMVTGLVAGIITLVLCVWCLVDACTSRRVPEQQRVMWILVLLFCNAVALPFYWHQVIWRDAPPAIPITPQQD